MAPAIVLMAMVAMATLSGCPTPDPEPERDHDQCKRRELFQACLAAIPEGPQRTHYNDWAEVVDSCETAARTQSYVLASSIPEGCR